MHLADPGLTDWGGADLVMRVLTNAAMPIGFPFVGLVAFEIIMDDGQSQTSLATASLCHVTPGGFTPGGDRAIRR